VFPGALATIFTLYYPGLYFNLVVVSENLFTPVFLLFFYLMLRADGPTALLGFVAGLLFASAYAVRPIVGPFLPLLVLWLLVWRRWHWKDLLVRYGLPFAASAAVLLVVIMSANKAIHRYEQYVVAENGGPNLAMNWCQPRKVRFTLADNTNRWYSSPAFWDRDRSTDIATDVPYYQQGYYAKLALQCVLDHPVRIVTNLGNLANIFHSRFYPDFLKARWHKRLVLLWKLLSVALCAGFFAYPLLIRTGLEEWTLALLLLLSLCASVYLANPGEERYLIPYCFVLLVWGIPSYLSLTRRVLSRVPDSTGARVIFYGIIGATVLGLAEYSRRATLEPPAPTPRYQGIVTDATIRIAQKNGAHWLARHQRNAGDFVYNINTTTGKASRAKSYVRQLLTSQGLAIAAKRTGDPQATAAHQRNLEFITSHLKKEDDQWLVNFDRPATRLNEVAFAILTFLDSSEARLSQEDLNRLGTFILNMQEADGSFKNFYPDSIDHKVSPAQRARIQRFAPGEAALVCARLYSLIKDGRYLRCARQAYKFYYPRIEKSFDASRGSWHTIAYSTLYEADRNPAYLAAIEFMADRLLELQNTDPKSDLVPGGFDQKNKWYTSAEAVFTEALGYAARSLAETKPEKAQRYAQANALGLQNLLYFQYGAGERFRVAGGIKSAEGVNIIQIDNIGHALIAFEEYLTRDAEIKVAIVP
jgi:hypothetical protein